MDRKKTHYGTAFCLGLILIGVLLQTGGMLKGNRVVFPGLPEIGQALFRLLGDPATYRKIGITLLHVTEALVISSAFGILAGLAEGLSEWIHSFLRPLMILIRSIPMIVLVILIMSIQNYRSVPVTAACMILIPMLSEAVYEGCRSLDPEMIDATLSSGISFIPGGSGYEHGSRDHSFLLYCFFSSDTDMPDLFQKAFVFGKPQELFQGGSRGLYFRNGAYPGLGVCA